MMSFSSAIRADLPTSSSNHHSWVCFSRLGRKQKRIHTAIPKGRESSNLKLTVRSVLDNRKPSVNDNGAAEPTRILFESLFSQTQKVDKWMNQDSPLTEDIQVGLKLENLESDLHAALVVLKKKEDTLRNAERMVFLEHAELERAKEDLTRREKEIAVVAYKQEQLEDALKVANLNLASKTRQIEDLKLQIKKRDCYISEIQTSLDLKQHELDSTRNELFEKNEELTIKNFELASKARQLNEANEIIKKQDVEIQELQKMVQEKQQELELLLELRKGDEEQLKTAGNNLKTRTIEYLVAHDEVKKIAEERSRNFEETNKTLAEFGRVKNILADIRSELIISQKSLSLTMEHTKSQELLLEGQLAELEEQKADIMLHFGSLKDAHVEIERQRVQFGVALDRNKELEGELSAKKEMMGEMEDGLNKEKAHLKQALREKCVLKEELDRKCMELEEALNSLRLKDSELVDAKLEIQRLQSQQSSLNQILNEKDAELVSAGIRLEEMSKEVVQLKMLVSSKEEQLVQTSNMLKEKDVHLQVMQHELNDSKLKYVDAENAVQRIVDLTNELVVSAKNESGVEMSQCSSGMVISQSKSERKQVEAEIALARENLRTREMEVLASQRALAIKDEELNLIHEKLELKEKELNAAKEVIAQEADELKKLHALAQERIGEKSMGDLAMEKLQIEAEAATSARSKLAESSRELLNTPTWFSEADFSTSAIDENSLEPASTGSTGDNSCVNLVDLTGIKTEVARLMALTEELLKEAGIAGCM